MDRIGKILDSVIGSLGLSKKLEQGKAMAYWEEAVGPEIAKHTVPLKIRGSKLIVQASSASWRNELMFLKESILAKLNAISDETVLTDIVFVAGGGRSHSE